ncbi:MAG: pantoate--beta-alanine ligase [Gemmatimonadota bacterium]
MKRIDRKDEVRDLVRRQRAEGRTVAFVPTMGYFHEGHLSLVDRARHLADTTVVSIYVNPLQFGPSEDFTDYPRDLERDARLAAARGVDVLFAPDDDEMYPAGEPVVRVVPSAMADRLCGEFRPGHFVGVLTVVAKLFGSVEPDMAVFGQKDYQQAALVRRMTVDLDLPVRIEIAPIVREPDGLALSSRNTYLDDDERRRAASLNRGLELALATFREGERSADTLRSVARDAMADHARIQYVELVDPDTLDPLDRARAGAVLAVAAFVGETRLIDNVILD